MYRLIRFGTVDLEHYNQVDAIGSGATPTNYLLLPDGGALDNFGSMQKYPGAVERIKSLRLRSDTEAALETLYFQLLALRGKRDKLYRRTASGDIHWQYARLVEIAAQRSYEKTIFKFIQDLDLRFVTQEATWRGDLGGVWYLDSGEYLDSGLAFDSGETYTLDGSPKAITVTIGTDAGRMATRALQIRVMAGSAPITSITIARAGGESLTFGASIAAGDVLLIDTGSMQVTNDGVDAYDDLTLSPTADLASWFALAPGSNALTVTYTGGGTGSTISFQYYEAWA
jgi:hypothetical protein